MEFFSHLGQDQWVADTLDFKRVGFFLDFGSLDGVQSNNTLALERGLGWKGICVEPNPRWYPRVCESRTAICINAALWHESGHHVEMVDAYGLSSLVAYKNSDTIGELRERDTRGTFFIETLSPNAILERFSVPAIIDYMSLDVEGAELDVLAGLDLQRYPIALMSIEHSEIPEKQKAIRDLLTPHGYLAVKRAYDDLFFNRELLQALGARNDPIESFERMQRTYVIRDS